MRFISSAHISSGLRSLASAPLTVTYLIYVRSYCDRPITIGVSVPSPAPFSNCPLTFTFAAVILVLVDLTGCLQFRSGVYHVLSWYRSTSQSLLCRVYRYAVAVLCRLSPRGVFRSTLVLAFTGWGRIAILVFLLSLSLRLQLTELPSFPYCQSLKTRTALHYFHFHVTPLCRVYYRCVPPSTLRCDTT
jgi:hypothetical protein